MSNHSNEELVSDRNSSFAQKLYRDRFPGRPLPSLELFSQVHEQLCAAGQFPNSRNNRPNIMHAKSEQRLQFCNWFVNQQEPHFSENILFTDDLDVRGDGISNNFVFKVWAGIIHKKLIGPVKFPMNYNGQNYSDFLKESLPHLLREFRIENIWYMHDGAPPHQTEKVRNQLTSVFLNRWIGKDGPVTWPAYSPDLNPMDFYVWAKIKETIKTQRQLNGRAACDEDEAYQEIVDAFETFRDANHFEIIRTLMDLRVQAYTCYNANG